jgi:hypothetical protein
MTVVTQLAVLAYSGCLFKLILKIGVGEPIVNAPPITNHGSAIYIQPHFLRCLCFYSADSQVVRSQSTLQRHL